MKKALKVTSLVLAAIIALFLLALAVLSFIFRNEISAISSIELRKPRVENTLQGGIYQMTFKGDYYLED